MNKTSEIILLNDLLYSEEFIDFDKENSVEYLEPCNITFSTFLKKNNVLFGFKLSMFYWFVKFLFYKGDYVTRFKRKVYQIINHNGETTFNPHVKYEVALYYLQYIKGILKKQSIEFKETILKKRKYYYRTELDFDSYVIRSFQLVNEQYYYITFNQNANKWTNKIF